jgi:hypothetical protein
LDSKEKFKISPFAKGVPERERGGGILERIRNSKALNFLKGTKSLFLVRKIQQYIYMPSWAQFILPLKREKNYFAFSSK